MYVTIQFIDSIGQVENADYVVSAIFHNNMSACESLDGPTFEQLKEQFFECTRGTRIRALVGVVDCRAVCARVYKRIVRVCMGVCAMNSTSLCIPSLTAGRVSFGCMQAFVNVVVCDGVPFKNNQARVIQLFNDVLHADDTSYMLCDDPACLPYRARRGAMAAMEDGDGWEPKYIKVNIRTRVIVRLMGS